MDRLLFSLEAFLAIDLGSIDIMIAEKRKRILSVPALQIMFFSSKMFQERSSVYIVVVIKESLGMLSALYARPGASIGSSLVFFW